MPIRVTLISLLIILLNLTIYAENFVKIAISESGVYSISYSDLRRMGFQDPGKVGVVGRGASILSIGKDENDDAVCNKVATIHANSFLFFYGIGPENIECESYEESQNKARYVNKGRNTYTSYGYYYLSDAPDALLSPSTAIRVSPNPIDLDWGLSYKYHELDLEHNTTDSGKLYWGERFNHGNQSRYEWEVRKDDVVPKSKAFFEFSFYTPKGEPGTFNFGFPGNSHTIKDISASSSNYLPINGTFAELNIDKGEDTLFIEYSSDTNRHDIANLDYWLLSFQNDFSGALSCTGIMSFPQLASGQCGIINFTNGSNTIGLDITNPSDVKLLRKDASATKYIVDCHYYMAKALLFNSRLPQKQISFWENADNFIGTDRLHNIAAVGTDYLIVSPEWLLPYAEEIAAIHEIYDDISATAVSISSVYEEFSQGSPDPEALRRFVALFADMGHPLSNLLLMGPCRANARDGEEKLGYANFHIIPQAETVNFERGAFPLIDYYGIADHNFDINKIERSTLLLGIGVLPFINGEEAETYIRKLENYIASDRHAYTLSDWLFVGGTGDNHTHEQQCVELAKHISSTSGEAVIQSILALDAYGSPYARERFMQDLDAGKSFIVYVGHAGNSVFDKDDPYFFSSADISGLRNNYLPFLFSAACNTSHIDNGLRGIGEEFVIGGDAGGIGSVISMREVWSGQNFDFAKYFINSASALRDGVTTIGEIVTNAKNMQISTNKLPFVLVGDPALRMPLPVPLAKVSLDGTMAGGNKIKVTGQVTTTTGKTDTSFNGTAVIKLCEPAKTLLSKDITTGGNENALYVTYGDNVASMAETEIRNGNFSTSLQIPSYINNFAGEECKVYVACFDPQSRKGAIGNAATLISSSNTEDNGWNIAPVINDIRYDIDTQSIIVETTDDRGISLSSTSLQRAHRINIDGRYDICTSLSPLYIGDNAREVTFFASINSIQPGKHTVAIHISDIDGNETSKEAIINIDETLATLGIEIEEEAIIDTASFSVDGSSNPLQVCIYTSTGKKVTEIDVKDGRAVWDRCDASGNRVAGGIYKAIAIETASKGAIRYYSPSINLPVIR